MSPAGRAVPPIRVIDSHTGGEPTRLVIAGGPQLGEGPLDERVRRFRERFDHYRSAIINEPRGSDAWVGALLCTPHRAGCTHGVIFFNNVGYIGMCGHGTIGLIASLAHAGECAPGTLRIDTPVGAVTAVLHGDGLIDVENVPSFRKAHEVRVVLEDGRELHADIAWGGNWFALIDEHHQHLELAELESLVEFSWSVRRALNQQGYPEVDHVELFGPPRRHDAHGRNFVLCPGKAYDRSPCGTGTSAKLACLAADGQLAEGERWVQESLIGSTFAARYRWQDRARGEVLPTITGTAHVTGEAELYLDARDPFCWGIPSAIQR